MTRGFEIAAVLISEYKDLKDIPASAVECCEHKTLHFLSRVGLCFLIMQVETQQYQEESLDIITCRSNCVRFGRRILKEEYEQSVVLQDVTLGDGQVVSMTLLRKIDVAEQPVVLQNANLGDTPVLSEKRSHDDQDDDGDDDVTGQPYSRINQTKRVLDTLENQPQVVIGQPAKKRKSVILESKYSEMRQKITDMKSVGRYNPAVEAEHKHYINSRSYVDDWRLIMAEMQMSSQLVDLYDSQTNRLLAKDLPSKKSKDEMIVDRKRKRPDWLPDISTFDKSKSYIYKTLGARLEEFMNQKWDNRLCLRCLEVTTRGRYHVWFVSKTPSEEITLSYCIVIETKTELNIAVLSQFFMYGNTHEERVNLGRLALGLCVEWLITLFCESIDYQQLTSLALDVYGSDPKDYVDFLLGVGFTMAKQKRLIFHVMN